MDRENGQIEDHVAEKVSEAQRHHWIKTAFIFAGGVISVPSIMLGAILVTEMSFLEMLISSVLGCCVGVAVFCLQGIQGTDCGFPTVYLARSGFGTKGASIIVSLLLAIPLTCWAGSGCEIAGESFIEIIKMAGVSCNRELLIVVLGLVMLTVAIFGEKQLSLLNIIAVPALCFLCVYGIIFCTGNLSFSELFASGTIDWKNILKGSTTVVGMVIVAATTAPDYLRFCRNRKESCLAVIVGIVPFILFLLIAGAIMGKATGEMDISILIAKIGLPVIGLIVLILATWTTMAGDAYTGGLSLAALLHFKGNNRAISTAISGGIGIVLAVFGIMDHYVGFLDLLAACIPPIAGVMIADYWVVKGGKAQNWREVQGVNWLGFISAAIGCVVALTVPFGMSVLNGVIASGACYLIGASVLNKKTAARTLGEGEKK